VIEILRRELRTIMRHQAEEPTRWDRITRNYIVAAVLIVNASLTEPQRRSPSRGHDQKNPVSTQQAEETETQNECPHRRGGFFLRNEKNEDEADDGKDRKEKKFRNTQGSEVGTSRIWVPLSFERQRGGGREQSARGFASNWLSNGGRKVPPPLLHGADERS